MANHDIAFAKETLNNVKSNIIFNNPVRVKNAVNISTSLCSNVNSSCSNETHISVTSKCNKPVANFKNSMTLHLAQVSTNC